MSKKARVIESYLLETSKSVIIGKLLFMAIAHRYLMFFTLFMLFGGLSISPRAHTAEFFSSPTEAFQFAKKNRKPVLIKFYADWCYPCQLMDKEVFQSGEFSQVAANFVLLEINGDREKADMMEKKYGVKGYPTVVYTDFEGEPLACQQGRFRLREFLAKMKQIAKSPLSSGAKKVICGT